MTINNYDIKDFNNLKIVFSDDNDGVKANIFFSKGSEEALSLKFNGDDISNFIELLEELYVDLYLREERNSKPRIEQELNELENIDHQVSDYFVPMKTLKDLINHTNKL